MAGLMSAHTGGGNRRAMARLVARHPFSAATRRLRQLAVCAVIAVAITVPVGLLGTEAQAATSAPHTSTSSWTPLTLQNGWTTSPFGTSAAAAHTISGIVHFKGAIATTGTNPVPFTLPGRVPPGQRGVRPGGPVQRD